MEDLGKIFAFISTLDGLTPIIMSQIYASIWHVSKNSKTVAHNKHKYILYNTER